MKKDLKNKIVKLNSYSILSIVFLFALLNFVVVYIVLDDAYQKEVNVIKEQYISSQKEIIKNQTNNFINFIEHIRKLETNDKLKLLQTSVKVFANILSVSNPKNFKYILQNAKNKAPFFEIGLSDTNGHILFATDNIIDHRKFRTQAIQKGFGRILKFNTKEGIKYSYILRFKNRINHKEYVIGNSIFQSTIDRIVQKIVIDRLNTLRFGAKNNGYISIAEILNYKGGDKFAKVIALPIRQNWVGKIISDDKKDAKGNEYRKEYLQIINTVGHGYVKYWFYKKTNKSVHPKISFVKIYKPFNWMIVAGVYLDDITHIIENKQMITKIEMEKIFYIYLVFLIVFLIIAYLISKYENKILTELIESYERLLHFQNEKLIKINKDLEKEVEEKTEILLDSLLVDGLTKLANREKLIMDLKDGNFYVAILNIDSFKEINDYYGIEIGDEVLRKFADMLKEITHKSYKLSADEFAIINTSLDELEKLVKKLLHKLSHTPFRIRNETINLVFNCGIGKHLVEADMALKYAKKHKYEAIVVFNEELNITKEYKENIRWKSIIKEAISSNNILTYIQPIVNNTTKEIDKYECLVRLRHNDKIYSPYFFLNIAKHTGKYAEIQKIMIENSFSKFSKLNYKFSINLSLLDLTNTKFKEFLLNKIKQYNVYDKLIIELLEDEALLNKEVLSFLKQLDELGIEIAIDDFGSGYSNFAYLIKDLPVSILKIDGSLVKNIAKSEKDYKLLESIIDLAKKFDFEIVAEFVENEEIFELLRKLKIDYSQGYYFSEPFDIETL